MFRFESLFTLERLSSLIEKPVFTPSMVGRSGFAAKKINTELRSKGENIL